VKNLLLASAASAADNIYRDTNGHTLGLSCFIPDDKTTPALCSGEGKSWECQGNAFNQDDPGRPNLYECTPRVVNEVDAHAEALAECNNKPTTIGVLFCRWEVK
jgi:hypothetical protein